MKASLLTGFIVMVGMLWGVCQEAPVKPKETPIKGDVSGTPVQTQTALPSFSSSVVVQERQYYGGLLTDLRKREVFKKQPYSQPNSPIQNPAIDLVTGRPRGVVLFSISR